MGQFIQVGPFEQKPRTSFLMGQAFGNAAQNAGQMYLQSKIQSMLEGKQQAASARGIASLYPEQYRQQVESAYSQIPLAYHGEGLKQAHEFVGTPGIDFSNGVPASILGRGGANQIQTPQMQTQQMQQPPQQMPNVPESLMGGQQPVQVQQNTQPPTPTAVAANIDALQRMGQGLPPNMQQAQGNVAPMGQAPNAEQQPPQPENIPLEDLTAPEVNRVLSLIPKKSDREAFIKSVENARKTAKAERSEERAEEDLSLKRRKTNAIERAEQRAEEKDPKEFLKSLENQYSSTLRKRPIYKEMERQAGKLQPASVYKKYLTDRLGLPPGFLFNDQEQVLDKLGNQLLQGVSSAYDQARILQTEVETYIKANPSLLNTPEGLQKLARISMALDDITEKKWKYGNEIRKEARSKGERLPEDLPSIVLEKEADYVEEAGEKIRDIMATKGVEQEYKEHQMISKNELKSLPIGTRVKKGEKIYEITPRGPEEVK
jgi:hypothetical protein